MNGGESDIQFLSRNGIRNESIVSRYLSVLRRLENFITVKQITQWVIIDHEMLKTAIYDYYVDIARVKDFQHIPRVNPEKIYGYMAYWLLKRKPIQVKEQFPGSRFINELFVTAFLITSILAEKRLTGAQCTQNETFNKFQSLLFYHLKYRPVSQQSLELMIEAFFSGCGFAGVV
jgi:hypothetical protein